MSIVEKLGGVPGKDNISDLVPVDNRYYWTVHKSGNDFVLRDSIGSDMRDYTLLADVLRKAYADGKSIELHTSFPFYYAEEAQDLTHPYRYNLAKVKDDGDHTYEYIFKNISYTKISNVAYVVVSEFKISRGIDSAQVGVKCTDNFVKAGA